MFQRDFMMRMIEQVGALVARILDRNSSRESVETELDAISAEWIGLPSSMLLGLPAEEVIRLFEDSNRMMAEKCYLMAEVCRAKGLAEEDEAGRNAFLDRALVYYRKCSGGGLEPEVRRSIEERLLELSSRGGSAPA